MSAPQATNPIDNVIDELKALIAWTLTQPSRVGYFASLYLRVTTTIRSKIGTGYFDDDRRMAMLDAAFASRYLSAAAQFRAHDAALPKAWAGALEATNQGSLIIVQHLLLSMNPHINIDLAAAAAQTCPGSSIAALHGDFAKINAVLAAVVPTVISEIGVLSPYLHLLSDLSEDAETSIINFSLAAARDASWAMAQRLAVLPDAAQEEAIALENVPIAAIGEGLIDPGFVASAVLDIIRSAEVTDVAQVIRTLDSGDLLPFERAAPALAGTPANQVYYFEVGPGSWSGTFSFQMTSWRKLWSSSMTLKNKLLAGAMQVFQSIFGDASISSELTPYPDRGAFGVAHNTIRIHKSWFTLWRSEEEYTLHPDGHRVGVDARVSFGPIAFLLPEHDIYPATVIDGGMRNLYHIKLLGARFLGDYRVQPGRRQVHSTLTAEWATAHEILNKL